MYAYIYLINYLVIYYKRVSLGTLDGSVVLLLKGSALEKGSAFVVFLKKSSDEALNGSASLNGSPPNGSGGSGHPLAEVHVEHPPEEQQHGCADIITWDLRLQWLNSTAPRIQGQAIIMEPCFLPPPRRSCFRGSLFVCLSVC